MKRNGVTLIELLIFVGIFTIVMGTFVTMLVAITNVQTHQSSQAAVTRESQFLLQQIQYNVELASVIDIPQDTATTTLRLRMPSAAIDPTIISVSSGTVYIQQGNGPQVALTSAKVSVSNLSFTRRANPPGHDSVSTAFTIAYNTSNFGQMFSEIFQTSVARVSAATFDSNLIPSSTNAYSVGQAGQIWTSINGLINFNPGGTGVEIGPGAPSSSRLEVNGDVYIDTTSGKGLVLRDSSGNCWRLTITTGGAIATSSLGSNCP